jgi:hypothetical protein
MISTVQNPIPKPKRKRGWLMVPVAVTGFCFALYLSGVLGETLDLLHNLARTNRALPPHDESRLAQINAPELMAAYRENEVAADERYKEKS